MLIVVTWSFLTSHARALLYISAQPDTRLRDLADALDLTERTAYGIVADLATAGYLVKEREGRRNRYLVQDHLPLPDAAALPLRALSSRERTVAELLHLLIDDGDELPAGGLGGVDRQDSQELASDQP